MFRFITAPLLNWLLELGTEKKYAIMITDFSGMLIIFLASVIAYYVTKVILLSFIHRLTKKTKTKWDDYLIENKLFKRLAYLVPGYILYSSTPVILSAYPGFVSFFQSAFSIYMVFILLISINSVLNASADIYNDYPVSKVRPIKGYLQTAKIIIYFVGGIVIIALMFNKNPLGLLGGLGAFTAVLLLVFKDPLLGFVAGIQLSSNNMLLPGDWIVMPKYDVDGTVMDISLTTIKVQNWDKTISTVPSYSLISDSFRNWRGMNEAGGRRIKKAVMIDISTINFPEPALLNDLMNNPYLKERMLKSVEIKKMIDDFENGSTKHQTYTNLTLFKLYLKQYLDENPNISKELTCHIHYLEPTEKGLPLEIYAFSRQIEWAQYEDIQSQIIDHVMAVIQHFGLKIFQSPSGGSLSQAARDQINA